MTILRTVAALLALACTGATEFKPNSGMAAEGAEDLLKSAAFEALDEAIGSSGGTIVSIGGKPYKVTSGGILGFVDDVVIDPILAVAQKDGDAFAKFDAWLEAASIGGLKVAWPAYGLVVDGGKVVIGGSIYTTEQMMAAVREQQIEAIIFGRGFGGLLGSVNNPLAAQNFLTIPKVFNAGITAQNFGEKITTREQLRELWFTDYRNVLVRELLMNAADVDAALNEGFGRLEEYWKLKRAGVVAERFAELMSIKVRAALARAEAEAAARAGESDPASSDDADTERSFGEDEGQIEITAEGDAGAVFGNGAASGILEASAAGTTDATASSNATSGSEPREPLTGQVFDLVEVKPDVAYEGWTVNPGTIEYKGYGYTGTYDWNTPPRAVGAEGFMLNLSVTCVTEKGQRMATGINGSGHFTFEPKAEVPANCEVDSGAAGSVDTRVKPPQQVAPGTEVVLRIGAFWGLGVTYKYRAR